MTAATPGSATTQIPAEPADTRQVIRPYGDTTGDGMVQLSFTLPVPAGKRAEAAALQLAGKMGLEPASVVHAKPMGPDFTFFIVYGRVTHLIDYASIPAPPEREYPLLTAKEVNLAIRSALGRRLVVVGACIGTDAHTVGIDAILNVKGFAGEKGLEYYREIQVINMGAQVTVVELVARAKAENADAVLVSQVVTQRNAHLHNTKQMAAAFHAEYPTAVTAGMGRPLLVVGGPRFDAVTADELGVDRIFGKGTTPSEVASYLVHALLPGESAQ
jgi:methanogenic corrinoid protein MtbC1